MPALLGVSLLGFAGYALLLPTAPLWATRGGADEGGAGLVNAVLMLATVAFQTTVPWTLRRWGWRTTLVIGVLLLGLPSFALVLTDQLAGILAVSAAGGRRTPRGRQSVRSSVTRVADDLTSCRPPEVLPSAGV
jgi:MFS family permease